MIDCNEVDVLFPRYPTDTTCFFNPCLENFVVRFNGRNYPNTNTSTVSEDFFKEERSTCILDGVWKCTESYENSQDIIPKYEYPIKDRTFGDNSEHKIKISLERVSANSFFFDGVSSVNETVRVVDCFLKEPLRDRSIVLKNNYYILNRHNYEPGKQNPEITAAGIVAA
jgi:hypothetical protein